VIATVLLREIKREYGARIFLNAVAAPATVSGEPSPDATGSSGLGRRLMATTREPGDLPSVVVTREHIGRGVLVGVELPCS